LPGSRGLLLGYAGLLGTRAGGRPEGVEAAEAIGERLRLDRWLMAGRNAADREKVD
jgi:hypothetical protein